MADDGSQLPTNPTSTGAEMHRPARPSVLRASRVVVLVLATALVMVPGARAGGDFVDLAVGGGRVWFVGPSGVRALDARRGRTLLTPTLRGAAYPLSVTLVGGAAWVASVENGYVFGTLSRIDTRSGKVRVVWRRENSSVQYVAAGVGGIWALMGSPRGARIALFALNGRLVRVWQIPAAGRMAADEHGCWVSTGSWLLHIDPAGPVRRIVRAPLGDITTGDGAVWLPRETSVLRIDERTGRQLTLRTGRLGLGGFQHDLAAGKGTLWALQTEALPFEAPATRRPERPAHRQGDPARNRRRARRRAARDLGGHRGCAASATGDRLRRHSHRPAHAASHPAHPPRLSMRFQRAAALDL
jgi:hypothetical protein